jgi:hypothetical protein
LGGPFILIVFCVSLFFSLAEAVLSVDLASAGVRSLSPVMNVYLELLGPSGFILLKYAITSMSLLYLVSRQDTYYFRGSVRGRSLLLFLPVLYFYGWFSTVTDALAHV